MIWLQWLGMVFILLGSFLCLVAAIGIVRLEGLVARMHVATKPQVLGVLLMCGGLAMTMQTTRATITLVLVMLLQLFVAPISAHLLGRGAYRMGRLQESTVIVDEFAEDLARAEELDDEDPDFTLWSMRAVQDPRPE